MADGHRGVSASAQVCDIELDADNKHEEQHADLAQHLERRERLLGKQRRAHGRSHQPEQRRAENDACRNLAHDWRLPHPRCQHATDTRGDDDDDELKDQVRERLLCVIERSLEEARLALRQARRHRSAGQNERRNPEDPGNDQERDGDETHIEKQTPSHAPRLYRMAQRRREYVTARSEGAKRPLKTLERVLSKAGVGSRTEARSWVHAGRVQVNGKTTRNPNQWIDMERDRVRFDDKPLSTCDRVYLLLYKPTGYLTTYKDPESRPTVYDLVADVGAFLRPVGRLDLDTSGLLLMTNDNQFAERVTNPESHVPKTYLVKASTVLIDEELQRLRDGIELADGRTRPATVKAAARLGKVHALRDDVDGRTQPTSPADGGSARRSGAEAGAREIGPVAIGTLPIGKWRRLTRAEVAAFR